MASSDFIKRHGVKLNLQEKYDVIERGAKPKGYDPEQLIKKGPIIEELKRLAKNYSQSEEATAAYKNAIFLIKRRDE